LPLVFLPFSSALATALGLDMAQVPAHLKCPVTNTLLREAVELPCCGQVCMRCEKVLVSKTRGRPVEPRDTPTHCCDDAEDDDGGPNNLAEENTPKIYGGISNDHNSNDAYNDKKRKEKEQKHRLSQTTYSPKLEQGWREDYEFIVLSNKFTEGLKLFSIEVQATSEDWSALPQCHLPWAVFSSRQQRRHQSFGSTKMLENMRAWAVSCPRKNTHTYTHPYLVLHRGFSVSW
jgi:hypothetical protein